MRLVSSGIFRTNERIALASTMRDRVICDKYVNIPKLINRDCVDLSIVVPPCGIRGSRQAFFREVLECMAAVTKPGGMCCLRHDPQLKIKSFSSNSYRGMFPNKQILRDYAENCAILYPSANYESSLCL